MVTALRITAVCACLLVLFSGAAQGQPLPLNVDGLNLDQFPSSHPAWPAQQVSHSSSLPADFLRLPPTNNTETPIYLASRNLDRIYTVSDTLAPDLEICDGCLEHECQCAPRWLVSVDALWMARSRANAQSMIFSDVTVGESFNASELSFEARSGFRLSWGYDLQNGRAVEISTLNAYNQPATANVQGLDLFFLIHNASPLVRTTNYAINYESNLHSGELNWWLNEIWGIRPMIGVRWIRVREEFSITDTAGTSLTVASAIMNDLVGAQIGFKTRLWNGGNWIRVEAAFKGGVYQNAVDYRATLYDNVAGPLVRINRYPSSTSLAGECIISAVIQCSPNLALRFGYQGLWMSEIGLTPNQANQSDIYTGAGSDDFEGLSFNGGFVGLEANW